MGDDHGQNCCSTTTGFVAASADSLLGVLAILLVAYAFLGVDDTLQRPSVFH